MAARVALGMKSGGPWSESWLASRLGISRGYLSRVLNDQQPMPQWMRRPISYATGYRLVEQFHALQTCERPEDGRAQIERIAQQAVRLVGGERRHDDREAA